MWDFIKAIFFAIIPRMDADPVHQYTWRMMVAVWLIVGTAIGTFHIAILCGYFPVLFKGYATQDQVAVIINTQTIMVKQGIERDIRDNNLNVCNQDFLKNYTARDYAELALEQALGAWRARTGYDYPYLPSCDKVRTVTTPPP